MALFSMRLAPRFLGSCLPATGWSCLCLWLQLLCTGSVLRKECGVTSLVTLHSPGHRTPISKPLFCFWPGASSASADPHRSILHTAQAQLLQPCCTLLCCLCSQCPVHQLPGLCSLPEATQQAFRTPLRNVWIEEISVVKLAHKYFLIPNHVKQQKIK